MLIFYFLVAVLIASVFGAEFANPVVAIAAGLFWPLSVIWFIFAWWASKR